MPIWVYKCKDDHRTEEIRKYEDREEPAICKTCGEPSQFKQTFEVSFQYGQDYNSISADRHRWNLRENKRLKTRGKSYA